MKNITIDAEKKNGVFEKRARRREYKEFFILSATPVILAKKDLIVLCRKKSPIRYEAVKCNLELIVNNICLWQCPYNYEHVTTTDMPPGRERKRNIVIFSIQVTSASTEN
jgi:hypothetical protein